MKKVLMVAVMAAFVSVVAGFAEDNKAAAAPAAAPAAAAAAKDMPQAVVYTCAKCEVVATAAGKCAKCGAGMQAMKVLSTQGNTATCCGCAADCAKCGEVKDGKCACGKDVAKLDLTGKFVCPKCHTVAAKAGKCACGADLVEVKAKEAAKKEEAAK